MNRVAAIAMASFFPCFAGPAAFSEGEGTYGKTKTPIKHLVVIFDENISFDHYFGTYPHALNPGGEPKFIAAPETPAVNGLTPALLHNNPNLNKANGTGAANEMMRPYDIVSG